MDSLLMEVLGNLWRVLVRVYYVVFSYGLSGCFFSFVAGWFMNWKGTRITGRSEGFRGFINNGSVDLKHYPAIEGTAKNRLDMAFGLLLKLSGTVLILIAFVALMRMTIYS